MKHHAVGALVAPCLIWAAVGAHAQGLWAGKASMPIAVAGAVTGAVRNKLYVTAGFDASHNPSAATQIYDPATNRWLSGPPIPNEVDFARGAVIGDNFYVVGGCARGGDCNTGVTGMMQAFNAVSQSWTTLASMPTPRYGFGLGVSRGHLFAVGGQGACPPCKPKTVLEEYDPAADAWRRRAPMPTARGSLAAGFANCQLFAVGGNDAGGAAVSTVEAYFPPTNTWATKASLPTPQTVAGVGVTGGHVFSVSGTSTGGVNVNIVQDYDALTDTWSTAAAIPTGRYFAEPVTIHGKLFVAGNGAANTATSSLERFTP